MVGYVTEGWLRLLVGLLGSGLIALGAYWLRSLAASGAIAAIIMGTLFVTFGRPIWFVLLIAFFVSSTAWSKWKRRHRSKQQAESNYAKSGRRDAAQVAANGGAGLLLCLCYAAWPHEGWLYAFVGVMGAVNADTWATEIGALSRSVPRMITSGNRVSAGTSGGVTLLGSIAALAGAAFIGLIAALLAPETVSAIGLLAAAVIGGTAGAFADSLLGATVQAMYRCPACGELSERQWHCSVRTERTRGFSWMTNDAVNMLSSAVAGLIAWVIGHLLFLCACI